MNHTKTTARRDMNTSIFAGNLSTKNATMRIVHGKNVYRCSVAVSRDWKDAQNAIHEKTQWVDIEFWGDRAEIMQNLLPRAKKVLVHGELPEARAWINDKGDAQVSMTVSNPEVQILIWRDDADRETPAVDSRSSVRGAGLSQQAPPAADDGIDMSEIPF